MVVRTYFLGSLRCDHRDRRNDGRRELNLVLLRSTRTLLRDTVRWSVRRARALNLRLRRSKSVAVSRRRVVLSRLRRIDFVRLGGLLDCFSTIRSLSGNGRSVDDLGSKSRLVRVGGGSDDDVGYDLVRLGRDDVFDG